MIRVVLVDDQAIVRAGVARILGPDDGFEVVAECSDGDEAVAAVEATRPDVVLMDIRMPRVDGLEATRRLAELDEPPPVLVLTTFDEDEVLWGAIQAGAAGFVLKDASAPDLIAAATSVASGGAWFDRAVTPRVLEAYRNTVVRGERQRQRLDQLTERESDVLRRMARGATNAVMRSPKARLPTWSWFCRNATNAVEGSDALGSPRRLPSRNFETSPW